jgi:hypothetical protein
MAGVSGQNQGTRLLVPAGLCVLLSGTLLARTLQFAGRTWTVKASTSPVGPVRIIGAHGVEMA